MELYPAKIKITSRQENKAYCLFSFYTLQRQCQLLITFVSRTFKLYQLSDFLIALLEADMDGIFIIMGSAAYCNTSTAFLSKIHIMKFQRYIITDSCDLCACYFEGVSIDCIIFCRIQLFICLLQRCKGEAF